MSLMTPQFTVQLASTPEDIRAAQRLRFEVFVAELGGAGADVDHEAGLERDRFDPFVDHLLLRDAARGGQVVGVYRLLRDDQARAAGQFYSEGEYDLAPLRASGRRLLELGRSCVQAEYRGGAAMLHLWQALTGYVQEHGIEVLFGVASFHGTDVTRLAHPLTHLHQRHLAPPELRVRSRAYQRMDLLEPGIVERKRAILETPALIKAYLRLGGMVGDGAFIDHAFNTTDVCLVVDTARLNARQREIYAPGGRA